MLPSSPTFGISLDEYDPRSDRGRGDAPDAQETRVWMPPSASGGQMLSIQPFEGLFGFLGRLVDAAKDWQDNLQGTLAGYRDRIVHVYLKPDEGGLNIVMPAERVRALGEYGAQAGVKLRDEFKLDEHRWRRFLVAMDRLDETLEHFTEAYNGSPGGVAEPFGDFLSRYPQHAQSYEQSASDLGLIRARAADLAKLGDEWRKQPKIPEKKLPHPKTDLRITPKP
jgi:hypothetical protein